MKKVIYSIAVIALTLTSCTGDLEDQFNDLEQNLEETQTQLEETKSQLEEQENNLEEFEDYITDANIIGDPIEITHDYSYNADNSIEETYSLGITNESYSYFSDHSSDIKFIRLYKNEKSDGYDNSYLDLYFYYNTSTNTVLTYSDGYNQRLAFQIYNKYGDSMYTSTYNSNNSGTQNFDLEVTSFDENTGEISLTATFTYASNYYYSMYDTDGEMTITYDGYIRGGYEDKPDSGTTVSDNNDLVAIKAKSL